MLLPTQLKNNKVDSKMFKAQVKKMMQAEDAARTIAAFTSCEGTPGTYVQAASGERVALAPFMSQSNSPK